VAESGGKYLFTNLPLPDSTLLPEDTRAHATPAEVRVDRHLLASASSWTQISRWLTPTSPAPAG